MGDPILISAADQNQPPTPMAGDQVQPAVAYGEITPLELDGYLVVWVNRTDAGDLSIRGTMVSRGGVVGDPGGLLIGNFSAESPNAADQRKYRPAVDFMGTTFMVAWTDHSSSLVCDSILGAQVTLGGAVDSPVCLVPGASGYHASAPAIGHVWYNYLLAFEYAGGGQPSIQGRIFDEGGELQGQPFTIDDPPGNDSPCRSCCVASDTAAFLVAWDQGYFNYPELEYLSVKARMVGSGGGVVSRVLTMRDGMPYTSGAEIGHPEIGFDGAAYLATWDDPVTGATQIFTRRVFPESTYAHQSVPIPVGSGQPNMAYPAVAQAGKTHLVVWQDGRNRPNGSYDIYGDTVPAVRVSSDATAPNYSQHITSTANADTWYYAYRTNVGNYFDKWAVGQNSIEIPHFAHFAGDSGAQSVGYASIVLCKTGNPWIWDSTSCLYLRRDGSWKQQQLLSGVTVKEAALAISTPLSNQDDMGYVVYSYYNSLIGTTYLVFAAFDSLQPQPYYTFTLDQISGDVLCYPSISVEPGDYFHIAWCRPIQGLSTPVYNGTYTSVTPNQIRQNVQPQWYYVAAQQIINNTELPASQTDINAYGQNLYVVWRGPNPQNANLGAIWWAQGALQPPLQPQWSTPWPEGQSTSNDCNYPSISNSGQQVVAWQESNGASNLNQVWHSINNATPETVSNHLIPCRYPQTNVLVEQQQSHYFTIWSEEHPNSDGGNLIGMLDPVISGNLESGTPLVDILGGQSDSLSPYCLERDGADSSGATRFDYGATHLTYRIPYLNPLKSYLVHAVAYQDTASETRQRLALRGDTWEARCRRAKRGSLSFVIPKGAYDSTTATLKFENVSGPYAAIAELKVFEFETPPAHHGDGEQSAGTTPLQAGRIELVVAPDPFVAGTRLSFKLHEPATAALTVCDVSGRVVRRLGSFVRPSGDYQVWFDGRDDAGRRLVPGVYFAELRTGTVSACRKVVLTR